MSGKRAIAFNQFRNSDGTSLGLDSDVRNDFSALDPEAQRYAVALYKQHGADPTDVFMILDTVKDPRRAVKGILAIHKRRESEDPYQAKIGDAIEEYRVRLTPDLIKDHYNFSNEEFTEPFPGNIFSEPKSGTTYLVSEKKSIEEEVSAFYQELIEASTTQRIKENGTENNHTPEQIREMLALGDRAFVVEQLARIGMSADIAMKVGMELDHDSFKLLYTDVAVMSRMIPTTSQDLDELAAERLTLDSTFYDNEPLN